MHIFRVWCSRWLRLSPLEEKEKLFEKEEKQKADRRGYQAETTTKRRLQVRFTFHSRHVIPVHGIAALN